MYEDIFSYSLYSTNYPSSLTIQGMDTRSETENHLKVQVKVAHRTKYRPSLCATLRILSYFVLFTLVVLFIYVFFQFSFRGCSQHSNRILLTVVPDVD